MHKQIRAEDTTTQNKWEKIKLLETKKFISAKFEEIMRDCKRNGTTFLMKQGFKDDRNTEKYSKESAVNFFFEILASHPYLLTCE